MKWWDKLPAWGKWLSSTVAGIAAVVVLIGYVRAGAEAVHWQSEADAMEKEIYQVIAAEKRYDRIQRNRRELKRLERDFIAGRYANVEEREFMKEEMRDLKAAIRCDEENICQ